jgi:hypothetical protein
VERPQVFDAVVLRVWYALVALAGLRIGLRSSGLEKMHHDKRASGSVLQMDSCGRTVKTMCLNIKMYSQSKALKSIAVRSGITVATGVQQIRRFVVYDIFYYSTVNDIPFLS